MPGPKRVDGVREQTGNVVLDRAQQTALDVARQAQRCPFLVGKAKRVRFAANTQRIVSHRLGVPAACVIIRHNSEGVAFPALREGAQTGLDGDNQLALLTNLACVLDLWFYPRLQLEVE